MSGVEFRVSSRRCGVLHALAIKGVTASEFLAAVEGRRAAAGELPERAYRCTKLRVKAPVCSAYVEASSRSVALPKEVLRATMLRLKLTRRVATIRGILRRRMAERARLPKVA